MAVRPVIITNKPTTTLSDATTVPTGKEWIARTFRACNKSLNDSTATVTIADSYVAFNATVGVGKAVNVFGPDSAILPAGTLIRTRAGANDTIDITMFFDERDV
ncbi:hypothetical protein D3218_13155 [Aureimonas flava]|uniref:Uncharacterized protein n=1 Tax=Aureimonas flava TaxID=2320271 RepID=A0A3A1WLI1_9HYPH|nr:hypothetical protein [Aureimonas flava]RIY00227.1 hypothetical protein D3218_13155 [Aureimonas flava]